MQFVEPKYSRSQVDRAGTTLARYESTSPIWDFEGLKEFTWANDVLNNWRASHGYPINTFQATLRAKLGRVDKEGFVAQRLKRAPSIVSKLRRFDTMSLSRMQDIGGLRAVVTSPAKVRKLLQEYESARFQHKSKPQKNYIDNPKLDGYRGIHLIFQYQSDFAPEYNGLHLELQIRTKLQHAWATGVETIGTFLSQQLKAGQGEDQWRNFFAATSAAFTIMENTAPVPGFENFSLEQLSTYIRDFNKKHAVADRLRSYAVAADSVETARGLGAYHLVVLNLDQRNVRIRPYPKSQLEAATLALWTWSWS
jgi:putative GTP pyrophosphokinase